MIKGWIKSVLRDRRLWLVSIVAFALLIAFLDKNNLLEARRLRGEIRELEAKKEYYQERITSDSTVLERLKEDAYLEQFAREHFLMKRKGEVIYLIK